MKHEAITEAWEARDKRHVEGRKLYAEGDKCRAEGDKLCAQGNNLCAQGNNLSDAGDNLSDAGDKLYAHAVIEKHGGKAIIDWTTGEIETE